MTSKEKAIEILTRYERNACETCRFRPCGVRCEILKAVTFAIRQMKTERPQGEWIPVSERLPEYSGLYLVSIDDLVTVANFTGNYFMHRGGVRVEVDAWQPLPEPYMKGCAKNEHQ